MLEFVLHDDTREDLRRIGARHPASLRRIVAALEAVQDDPVLLTRLNDWLYRSYADPDVEIKRWAKAGRDGFELRRLKFFELEENGCHYRIVYAIDDINEYCHVLAVLRRDEIDYDDTNNPFTCRIRSAYAALGI